MNTGHSLVISDGEFAIRVSDMGSEGSAWGDAKKQTTAAGISCFDRSARDLVLCEAIIRGEPAQSRYSAIL